MGQVFSASENSIKESKETMEIENHPKNMTNEENSQIENPKEYSSDEDTTESENEEESEKEEVDSKLCQICSQKDSKYTCPGCLIKFCSVDCSKKHKEDTKCTGERSKTKYIDLKEFKNSDIVSDYHFLEDTKSLCENSNRHRSKNRIYHVETPDHIKFIQKRALAHQVLIRILSEGMYKRKTNTTSYINKDDEIFWKVEFKFGDEKITNEKTSENRKLFDLISEIFKDPLNKQKLHQFDSVFTQESMGFKILLSVEKQTSVKYIKDYPCYYELDFDKTLNENLKHKEIFEYPTFEVVLNSNLENYQLLPNEIKENIENDIKGEIGKVIRSLPRKFGKNKEQENNFKRKERNFSHKQHPSKHKKYDKTNK
eukprot:gene5661-9477_t